MVYILTIILGIFINCFWEMFIFISFIIVLRGYTGGYHLHNSESCIIGTVIISFISTLIASNLKDRNSILFVSSLLFMSSACIYNLAPINHPNLCLTKEELKVCSKFSKQFLGVELIIILLLIVFNIRTSIIISACFAIIVVAILMIIAKIKKQEV